MAGVEVRSVQRGIRMSAQKVRLVLEVVRGTGSVQICLLPERSRRAITSLVWRKGPQGWKIVLDHTS